MSKRFLFVNKLIFSLLLIAAATVAAFAQAGTATVTGTVSDDQGNVVPGAAVKLISAQNTTRSTVTTNSGVYTFSAIQPGTYQIEVEGTGFKKSVISNFQALVDKTTDISVKLEVGTVTQTVEVNASGVENLVNTTDAKLGNNFVSQQILELPLQGRNVADLLSLQPGVTPDGSVAGGRSDQANITLDGVDVNNQQDASAFSPVIRVNPDSVDEFRVTTSNPDAAQGRSSGAQISFLTKSGGNTFNGALYEYHRNTATSANSYFNNAAGRYTANDSAVLLGAANVGDERVPRPKLIRNVFGGRLGGPIIKDRLFFFYNYDGMREAKGVSVNQVVPLASLGQGNLRFRNNLGNLVTLNTTQINNLTSSGAAVVNVNPVTVALLADAARRYPANNFNIGDSYNTGGYRFNASVPVSLNAHAARLDWTLTKDQKHQLALRGNYQQDDISGVQAFPDTRIPTTWNHPLAIGAAYTWLVSSKFTNRFNYGLTRLAYSNSGDNNSQNAITFRNVFYPSNYSRPFSRVNPTTNITNDSTWLLGNHNLQFGTNIRIVRNKRAGFSRLFDNGVTNFSYYASSGGVVITPLNQYLAANGLGSSVSSADRTAAGDALTALFGRLSQYSVNYNFGLDGKLITNEPIVREWATEEYDFYVQDSWKPKSNLTVNLGLRYGLSRPVYETQGYQVTPNIPLQEYFERRVAASARGENYTEPLIMNLAGPKNGRENYYKFDKNNFQPRLSAAWSPNFKTGFLSKIFGSQEESVIRGGFAITNDYFGQQLAVTFDSLSTLGFQPRVDISANAYNVLDCAVPTSTCRPGPLYTGPNQIIRGLPGTAGPSSLVFPQQQSANNSRRIETSLDTDLVSPINYSWNVSYGRKLPGKMVVDVAYVGRLARNLLATRDVMSPNNIRDPKSGQTWYEAATALEVARQKGTPVSQIGNLPFFENMYAPGLLDGIFYGEGYTNTQAAYLSVDDYAGDWTYVQELLDTYTGKRLFYQNQYGALSSFGTIGSSDFHGMTFSLRQRLKTLTWDLNYTYSKSMDDASGLQTGGTYGSAFILNALRQQDARSVSDFDLTHIVNFNSVWQVPIGRNKQLFGGMSKTADFFLGGWQISSIFRYNTGYPIYGFYDNSGWQTNWNVRSNGVRVTQFDATPSQTSGTGGVPNLFSNVLAAYRSYRTPYPGESGDRNQLRYPSYVVLDAGLAKNFKSPFKEGHRIQFRWDMFNVTNTARFTGLADTALGYVPANGAPSTTFGNFTDTQGNPRIMQFTLRYDF